MTETAFADLRARVADALDDPTSPLLSDVAVLPDVVDSLTPPAWLLTWGDPWMVPATFCTHTVRLDVVCIAGRIDPAPGIATIEEMVAVALSRLRAAGLPEATVLPPARYDVGGVPYLAARISIDARIAVPLPEIAPTKDGAAQLVANAVLTATGATSSFAVKSGAVSLSVTATLTATGATGTYPTSTATATLSTTGTLSATGVTAAWPRQSGAVTLATTPTLSATGAVATFWTPAAIPGAVSWHDAADTATITASGGNVSQWADKISTRHWVQPTGALQPATGATVNGRNAINLYPGSSPRNMAATYPAVPQPLTILSVYKLAVLATGQGRLLETIATASRILVDDAPNALLYGGASVTGPAATTAVQQQVGLFNSTSSTLYQNRALTSGDAGLGFGGSGTWYLGQDGGGSFFGGVICEFVVVAGTVSSGDRASWDSYCAGKWGTP